MYGRPETRIVSQAFFSRFSRGSINPETLQKLRDSLRNRPDPEVYALLAAAMRGNADCLSKDSREYLESEALRLAESGPNIPGGILTYCQSALKLLSTLEENEASCGNRKGVEEYRAIRARFAGVLLRIKDEYGGI